MSRLLTGKPGWNMLPAGAPHLTRNSSDSARTSSDWPAAPPAAAAVGASRYISAKFTILPTCGHRNKKMQRLAARCEADTPACCEHLPAQMLAGRRRKKNCSDQFLKYSCCRHSVVR
eukprot:GHRQ01017342.1.p2 GENE.GHRQ01017342.1~~GHRQ01017342.1.p2  ORF type:complete len:117 (+),score=15.50 GHRQ01017342.1:24-374(+)